MGRSTQVTQLRLWLEQEGHAVLDTGMARSALAGKGIAQAKEGNTLGPVTMTLYYVTDFADRLENEIIPALRAGFVVLTDRYIFSIMARAIARGEDAAWIERICGFGLVPHSIYYLRAGVKDLVSRGESAAALTSRESGMDYHFGNDMYESFREWARGRADKVSRLPVDALRIRRYRRKQTAGPDFPRTTAPYYFTANPESERHSAALCCFVACGEKGLRVVELYVFRHGIAEISGPGQSDSARALTDEGRKKVSEVVKTAKRAGFQPSLIVSSPYLRAVQTAEIAASELKYHGQVVRTEALVPHGSRESVWTELRDYREESAILLAGHEPLSRAWPMRICLARLRCALR